MASYTVEQWFLWMACPDGTIKTSLDKVLQLVPPQMQQQAVDLEPTQSLQFTEGMDWTIKVTRTE